MSSEYRGLLVPTPESENRGWVIQDENVGVFRHFNEDVIVDLWKLRVDYLLTKESVERGEYDRLEDGFACKRCGNLVVDIFLHNDFFHST